MTANTPWHITNDLRGRLANRVQLTTDGHKTYLQAVEDAFGIDIDYAMLIKICGEGPTPAGRLSPSDCIGTRKDRITGNPDRAKDSISYVERSHLSMRMHMKRFARLTNAHSRKFENHCHMVALYTTWYNCVRINSAVKMAPAMAAGVSKTLWEMSDIVALIDKAVPASKKRGPYRKAA